MANHHRFGTTFDTQYAAARLAMTAGGAEDGDSKLAFSEFDDYCGNGLPKIPWPRPRGLYELLLRERELLGEAILGNAELDARGRDAVNAALDRQVERFKQLEL